jgi:hypothetical protein
MDRFWGPLLLLVVVWIPKSSTAQQWTIEEPTIEYGGLRLVLDYTISGALKEDDVSVAMFQDDTFIDSINEGNDFLTPLMVVDGSSGTQKVRERTFMIFLFRTSLMKHVLLLFPCSRFRLPSLLKFTRKTSSLLPSFPPRTVDRSCLFPHD